jgi:ABC-type uncharacterized transport system permease subunit
MYFILPNAKVLLINKSYLMPYNSGFLVMVMCCEIFTKPICHTTFGYILRLFYALK